ncbi:hypothetical protein [Asanoa ishikariensis]|nr:hypothetical protein [Asanoa ishikariensis]
MVPLAPGAPLAVGITGWDPVPGHRGHRRPRSHDPLAATPLPRN